MGLQISSGLLIEFKENKPEGYEYYKAELEKVNKLLLENDIEAHQETEDKELETLALGGMPFAYLHYLRRFFAYNMVHEDWTPEVFDSAAEPTDDPILEEESMMMYSHLLTHSDSAGFYIPQEFDEIIFETDETPVQGGIIGSSYRLLKELKEIASKLGVILDKNDQVTNRDAIKDDIFNNRDFWIEKEV
ncbi:hypothetical protein [Mesonia aestuariivivens]|uniref:SMI1/KNR4 family protein n=1 Tax=Mesonia aestuariivivens TaxID=2796128 RepID=A0ABS6W079_9FLAO|nr:hypothetical protein [Mesonia aestuariivivens]MBW2960553.1 hypothetical protein [Mesonia aestuariivivens]